MICILHGYILEGSGKRPLKEIQNYLAKLKREEQLERYFESAQKYISPERVIFTGYLTHQDFS